MKQFSAITTSGYTIEIDSNTYWSCKAEGNFTLSSYNGSGSSVIDVNIPIDEITAEGVVHFSYGDGYCRQYTLDVYYSNNCYVSTNPSYEICNGKKTIFLKYKQPNEEFIINIFCFGGWEIDSDSNVSYFINGDNLMVVSPTTGKGSLRIIPSLCKEDLINVIFSN